MNEIAWAAGFFDGEGNTYARLRGPKWVMLVVQVPQTDRRVLDRLHAALGYRGLVAGPYDSPSRRGTGANPQWKWYATGWEAEQVLAEMWPFLSEAKREQATPCLELRREHRSGYRKSEA